MKSFQARLDILPPAQQYLWPRFSPVNGDFVLYGGTALALRLGHRQSVDFDFFTHRELEPEKILSALPFLEEATVLQSERNTYTFQVAVAEDFVRISFFGTVSFGRVQDPEWAHDHVLRVASEEDLLATKLKVVMQRIETKDYQDIAALLVAGHSLAAGLGATQALFGNTFSPVDCLRALEYFEDPLLDDLSRTDRTVLKEAVQEVVLRGGPVRKMEKTKTLFD
ncbi:MAG: nucleotidyl transferase AbiEii/AbiGii toxin family protein [Alkalispirochaeta sp.]